MKIGTLLTAAIVSLSTVGGGLAVYVAVTKYQTMERVSVAQSRLEVVRAVGEIPRYMNPERGFATNILYGPPAVDPKMRAELNEKYRKNTDGARDKMNAIRKNLSGGLDDATAVGAGIDALNVKFAALREAMDKAIDGPAESRKDAARKIVAGGPIQLMNDTTTAHAMPAPTRSAKYSRPIWSDRRAKSVAIITPTAMNDANSARQMPRRRARLSNDDSEP